MNVTDPLRIDQTIISSKPRMMDKAESRFMGKEYIYLGDCDRYKHHNFELYKKILVILIGSLFINQACQKRLDYVKYIHNPDLYAQTVHELNRVVMGNNFSPVVSSRNYTYASIASYEVIALAYPNHYESLVGQLHGLNEKPHIVLGPKVDPQLASVLAYIKVGEAVTFPEGSMQEYKKEILEKAYSLGLPRDISQASQIFADSVGNVILRWSKKDNYLQTRSAEKYMVQEDIPGRWVPTPPAYTQAVEPHWNKIRPLIIDSVQQFKANPPLAFDIKDKKSRYYQQVMMVIDSSKNLTEEQKHIANFWDDNPGKLNISGHVMFINKKFSPTGHWMNIACLASKTAHADFQTTVYSVTKTAISFFDAFIQCWNTKYQYNSIRPESVINKYFDLEWRPLLQTPPFPEYTCGHSTISAAAAEALTSIYGDHFAYTDSTELEFGIKNRNFSSFRQAALENQKARFYGGIHFHYSCIEGTRCGALVGDLVVKRLRMKK